MDPSDEITSKGANVLEEEPSINQHLKRSKSPPCKKVLVYDCDEETVKVKSEKDISQSRASTIHEQS